MKRSSVLTTLALLSLLKVTLQESCNPLQCAVEENGAQSLKLSLNGRKNSTGDWITEFSARKEISNSSRNLNVEVEHKIFECNGKTVIHIGGFVREQSSNHGNAFEKIAFNAKHGKNVVIINNGSSAFRTEPEREADYGILLSSRPLKENELFEIRLESKLSKWGANSMGVGVTSMSISTFTLPVWMRDVKSNTWMMYNGDIYVHGGKKISNYGKNLIDLKVGDRIGVMRTSNGELHVYINGTDQGIAATEVPENIHAVVDLIRDYTSVTIL